MNKIFNNKDFLMSNRNNNQILYAIFIVIVFLLSPFLSILLQSIFLIRLQDTKNIYKYFLIISISIFLGLVNTTISRESDIVEYLIWFNNAKDLSFHDYILTNKEAGFSSVIYLMYYVFFGSEDLFIFSITFFIYIFLLTSIIKFYSHYKIDNNLIVIAIFIAAFMPQFFAVSLNIIRQLLASSILFYFLIMYLFYNKIKYHLLLLAILIHSSVLIFLPALLLNKLLSNISLKKMIFLVLPTLIFISMFYVDILLLITRFFNFEYLIYTIAKITSFHSNYLPPDITIIGIISFLAFIILLRVYTLPSIFSINNVEYKQFSLFFIVFLFFFITTFELTEISHRLIFYAYYFIPFIIPILIFKNKSKSNLFYSLGTIIFMSTYFIYKLENSIYDYESTEQIFTVFIPTLFLN